MNRTLRFAVATAAAAALAGTLVLPSGSATAAGSKENVLRTYNADTWRSMAAMAEPGTGLVSDNIAGDLSPASRAKYTSPTNIGAYIWSAVAARKTGLITSAEEVARVQQTLTTLERLE